jgi:hypothetical protein
VFRRAVEHGNLVAAELSIREMGVIGLDEALEFVALIAQKGEWPRARRAAGRWLERYVGESAATIDEAVFAAGCLAALGGPSQGLALAALRELAQSASSRNSRAAQAGQ